MGQAIEVMKSTVLGDVAVFDTDRSLTGMDGYSYASGAEAAVDTNWSAQLAQRLFLADPTTTNVYVYSNTISVQRRGGWSDANREAVATIIAHFFMVYEEDQAG